MPEAEIIDTPIIDDNTDSIVTTEEELQAFYIIETSDDIYKLAKPLKDRLLQLL